ncbi:MAG: hypothetical protein JNM52_10535 [Betaproteobacteria bacterium]|nr:hypothetical protein [Betaproteobacteria bacterium]
MLMIRYRCLLPLLAVLLLLNPAWADSFDRQFDNILYAIPENYVGIQYQSEGIVMVRRDELVANRNITHSLTISKSATITQPDLMNLNVQDFCNAFALAIVIKELGKEAIVGQIEISARAEKEGYDVCQLAAKGVAEGKARSTLYTFTRVKGKVAYITLSAPGDENALRPHTAALKSLIDSVEFANLGKKLSKPAKPLPSSFDAYKTQPAPTPQVAQSNGKKCRTETRQQCMTQMFGSFPNAYPVYNCLPRPVTICD